MARDEVKGVIQAVVRWKTVEAMRIYARIDPAHYAQYVDMAASLEGESGEEIPDLMPAVDPEAMVEEGAAANAAIDEETRAAANARRAEAKRRATANAEPGRKRRQAPTSGQPHDDAPEHSAAPITVEVDGGVAVTYSANDSWGASGQTRYACITPSGDGMTADTRRARWSGTRALSTSQTGGSPSTRTSSNATATITPRGTRRWRGRSPTPR